MCTLFFSISVCYGEAPSRRSFFHVLFTLTRAQICSSFESYSTSRTFHPKTRRHTHIQTSKMEIRNTKENNSKRGISFSYHLSDFFSCYFFYPLCSIPYWAFYSFTLFHLLSSLAFLCKTKLSLTPNTWTSIGVGRHKRFLSIFASSFRSLQSHLIHLSRRHNLFSSLLRTGCRPSPSSAPWIVNSSFFTLVLPLSFFSEFPNKTSPFRPFRSFLLPTFEPSPPFYFPFSSSPSLCLFFSWKNSSVPHNVP